MSRGDFEQNPIVGVAMGSDSDLEIMQHAALTLEKFEVPHEVRILSAHRTPKRMAKYGREAIGRGLNIVIAGAGDSAHLPGELASYTRLPTLGVGLGSTPKQIENAIGSMIGMPEGVPLAFMGLNKKGAVNAGLEAVRILSNNDPELADKYKEYVSELSASVAEKDEYIRMNGMKAYLARQRQAEEERQHG